MKVLVFSHLKQAKSRSTNSNNTGGGGGVVVGGGWNRRGVGNFSRSE